MSDTMLTPKLKEISDQIIELYEYYQSRLGLVDPDRTIELVKVTLVGNIENPRNHVRRSNYLDDINDLVGGTD